MLTVAEAGAWMDAHLTRSAFRLELLPAYDVASDGEDLARYLAGEPEPDPARKEPWLEELRKERAAGIRRYRVHVLTTPLTPYLRYECEWGYTPNAAAGEDICIVDETERGARLTLSVDHDFWLVDGEHVLRMHYDDAGRLLGCEALAGDTVRPYLAAHDAALDAADPFATWWARHPEEQRESRAA